MKQKLSVFGVALIFTSTALAQNVAENSSYVIDTQEDTTDVTTIKDIVKIQQEVTRRNTNVDHFSDVWHRKTFLNLSFNHASLDPKDEIYVTSKENSPAYYNQGLVPLFKSTWGVALQNGANYRLHKRPIGNMIGINLDYTWIDLSVNHYDETEGENKKIIDNEPNKNGNYTFYTPWNAEKYEANYGMSLGPSITLAPFTLTHVEGLHYIKINAYYHFGYGVSLLLMDNKVENASSTSKTNNGMKMDLSTGIYSAFGMNLTWKSIGCGFETRNNIYEYKSLASDDYGDKKYKFKAITNRMYLQFRF